MDEKQTWRSIWIVRWRTPNRIYSFVHDLDRGLWYSKSVGDIYVLDVYVCKERCNIVHDKYNDDTTMWIFGVLMGY